MDKNFETLVKDYGSLIGNIFTDKKGNEFIFEGILYGEDDYYFVMRTFMESNCTFTSCVASLEQAGYHLYEGDVNEN